MSRGIECILILQVRDSTGNCLRNIDRHNRHKDDVDYRFKNSVHFIRVTVTERGIITIEPRADKDEEKRASATLHIMYAIELCSVIILYIHIYKLWKYAVKR